MSSLPEVMDASGREIRLTVIIGKGGEGAVYGISSSDELVAKIYHKPLSAERAAKIQLMATLSDPSVRQLSAWPVGLVLQKSGRTPIGLIIPKVKNSKDVHKLYSPKSRQTEFPRADWRFLIRASANIARSFGAIHQTGCVIGDVNEGSVLVAENATVRLIDCDSFQVIAKGRRFACEVGVETFTPPELQSKNLREIVRTTNHDNFGLAIMVFLLLFMGRHPFAGRFLGRGDMPIPKAISELRFAYSAMRADVQMDTPPGTPPLAIVGDDVAFLFERAFAKQMMLGGRPEPTEWIDALSNLERRLKQCNANPSHWHLGESSCPWCPMEATTGIELFPFLPPSGGTPLDLTTLWRQIESLQSPGASPEILVSAPQPSSQAKEIAGSYTRANVLAFGLALVVGGIGVFGPMKAPAPLLFLFGALLTFFGARRWLDRSSDVYKLRAARDRAEATWTDANKAWIEQAGPKAFDDKRQEVMRLKQATDFLPTLRTQKLDALKNSMRNAQLVRFLDGFDIDKARIDGIGDGRKRTLQSYGIETAADLLNSRVESVPGFGPKLCSALYGWRRTLESQFKFNPAVGIDKRDIDKIEQDIAVERRRLEQAVRTSFAELSHLRTRAINARNLLKGPVEAARKEYLQASVDYNIASGT